MKAKLCAEFLGTLFLLMVVVGSGIMGEKLAGGNQAIALLANSLATGAGLYVLIHSFGPISGAHFNPLVSLSAYLDRTLKLSQLLSFWGVQILGAFLGVLLSHWIFDISILQISEKERFSLSLWVSEVIATFGLLLVIRLSKARPETPGMVALFILAAYWFTSSTSFANPAVTLARMFTNTFCGISPISVLPFIGAQALGFLFERAVSPVWKRES